MRIPPPFNPYPRRLAVRLLVPRDGEEPFSDLRFSAALFWKMIQGERAIDSILNIPADVERDGHELLLKRPADLPSKARIFGMGCDLPLEAIGRDDVWELQFFKHGSWNAFAINGHPVAVLGSDSCSPGPLPPGDGPLAVSWCAYRGLDGFVPTTRITQVQIQSLEPLTTAAMHGLQFLSRLERLEFVGKSIREISSEILPQSLKSLVMSLPEGVEDLFFLSHLADLTTLHLTRCGSLRNIEALENFESIRELKLIGAAKLKDLSAISGLRWMRRLDLSGATVLEKLGPVASLERLERLTLMHCEAIENLWPLVVLKRLHFLDLGGCRRIKYFLPLRALPQTEVMMPDWLGG